jgi:hypothetical protein
MCNPDFYGKMIPIIQIIDKSLGEIMRQRTLSLVMCFTFIIHFSISKVSYQLRRRKSNKYLRIPSHWTLRWPRTAACPFWTIFVHVRIDTTWESAHDSGCQLWFPSPYSNVLLPLQSVIGWCRFNLNHCPQDVCAYSNSECSNLLCGLPDTDVFLSDFCIYGRYASECEGLWLVYGHMSPSTLLSHYEPSPLWFLSFDITFSQYFGGPDAQFGCNTNYQI